MPEPPDAIVPARIEERGYPPFILSRPPTISETASRAFWAWAQTKYSPEEIERIVENPDRYFRFYQDNIQGTQWEVGPRPTGLEQPEAYGVTTADWQGLTGLIGDDAGLQSQLQGWISAGRIDQSQAADIWDELFEQTMRESRARASAQQRTDFMLAATGQAEAPGDRERRLAERGRLGEQARLQKLARGGQFFAPTPARPQPFTEFGTAEEFRTGFDIPQTERAISWFRSRFPRLIEQFRAKPEAERTAKTWAEFIEEQKPETREAYYRQTPYERGERPSVFAPRVTTVGF